MPEKKLTVIKPLYTIEPASPEETKRAEKRIREYHANPSSFVPFKPAKSVKTKKKLALN